MRITTILFAFGLIALSPACLLPSTAEQGSADDNSSSGRSEEATKTLCGNCDSDQRLSADGQCVTKDEAPEESGKVCGCNGALYDDHAAAFEGDADGVRGWAPDDAESDSDCEELFSSSEDSESSDDENESANASSQDNDTRSTGQCDSGEVKACSSADEGKNLAGDCVPFAGNTCEAVAAGVISDPNALVCGCDDVTYLNEACALAANQGVKKKGICTSAKRSR